jgi:hypothetical protein
VCTCKFSVRTAFLPFFRTMEPRTVIKAAALLFTLAACVQTGKAATRRPNNSTGDDTPVVARFASVSWEICLNFGIFSGYSIKCWVCRSDVDPKCNDPFDNSTLPITDCSKEVGLPHLPGVRPNLCRKIRQKGAFCCIFSALLLKLVFKFTI